MGKIGAKGDSYYGKIAANYLARRANGGWWDVEQSQMQALLQTLPRDLKLLDVPFGTGRFVPYYHERGHEVHGLDISRDMIAAARKALGRDLEACRITIGTATDLPFRDGSFDLICSVRFIRDIIVKPEGLRALAEFARVTNRYAIIQLGQHLYGGADDVAELDETIPLHSQLSAKGNEAMLAALGFKIKEMRRVKHDPDIASEIYHFLLEKD
jgi:ubiquinone/menaquinone biosynthesis C-methylase UbiE